MNEQNTPVISTSSLAWLADAPLFLDDDQIRSFYDAIVMPETTQGKIVLEKSHGTAYKVAAKLGVSGEISISAWLKKLFPFLDAKVAGSGEGSGEGGASNSDKSTLELLPISTPQRQLVQLALHYSANWPGRLQFIEEEGLGHPEWRSEPYIQATPRALAFIELPGLRAAREKGLVETKLIPTAAEFSNGEVVLLYEQLRSKDGRQTPPKYEDYDASLSETETLVRRKEYWNWFDDHFEATKAMAIVEAAAEGRGSLRWIDFRVPISREGDTLHLHICPAERYNTGAFAYNFVKRGFKHGLRIVGTLKSEPDVNVLAIFEK